MSPQKFGMFVTYRAEGFSGPWLHVDRHEVSRPAYGESSGQRLSRMPPPTKRRRLSPTAVEEISFDLSARQEYLTGFHKRKVQRTKAAQEAAQRRAKEELKDHRRKVRQERRADLERHVQEVNAYFRPETHESEYDGGEGDEDDAASHRSEDEAPVHNEPVDHQAEYIDEDKYTSVVVEEMDITRDGLRKAQAESTSNQADGATRFETKPAEKSKPGKSKWTKDKPKDATTKAKTKRKKFRYESKAERRTTRDKEKSKNRQQARARREK